MSKPSKNMKNKNIFRNRGLLACIALAVGVVAAVVALSTIPSRFSVGPADYTASEGSTTQVGGRDVAVKKSARSVLTVFDDTYNTPNHRLVTKSVRYETQSDKRVVHIVVQSYGTDELSTDKTPRTPYNDIRLQDRLPRGTYMVIVDYYVPVLAQSKDLGNKVQTITKEVSL
jgi:hypothetical protein